MPFDLSKLDTSHLTHLTLVGDHATHIEHIEHYHAPSATRQKPMPSAQSAHADAAGATRLPASLSTPRAMELWQEAQRQGWVDENYQLLISHTRGAILGSIISDELQLTPRWTALEQVWGIDSLTTCLVKSQSCSYYAAVQKEMENALL